MTLRDKATPVGTWLRHISLSGEQLVPSRINTELISSRIHQPSAFLRLEIELPGERVVEVRVDTLSGLVSSFIHEGVLVTDDSVPDTDDEEGWIELVPIA